MAADDLPGRSVLAIVTSYGVEQDEPVVPVEHLRAGVGREQQEAAHLGARGRA